VKTRQVLLPDGQATVIEWFDNSATPCKGVVAFLPALGVNAGYYRALAEAWAARGYRIALVEMRGMQQSSVRDVRRCNFGYDTVLNIDLATVLPLLAREADAQQQPFYLAGHSLGAQLSLLYASRHPQGIAGIIALAAGSNYYASMPSWAARSKRSMAVRFVRIVAQVLGFFPGDKLGFAGCQPQNMMLDWTGEALSGQYRIIGDTTDYNAALERLGLPVLLLSLSADRLVPSSCADFLARKLKHAQVSHMALHADAAGGKAFSHFSWVKRPDAVLKHVDLWENEVAAARKNKAVPQLVKQA
jgi:predicted alpha/beta hydrolase